MRFHHVWSLVALYGVLAQAETFQEMLEKNHMECTPLNLKNAVLNADNLENNNLGNLKSKFCGDPGTSKCDGEPCCSEKNMRFVDIFPDWANHGSIDLVITNTTEYDPRSSIPSPPNGLDSGMSDLPQINLGTQEQVELQFSFEDSESGDPEVLDYFDITFYDIDSGLENAVEEITVCNPGLTSIFLSPNSSVAVSFDNENECVTFSSTVLGFAENNPNSSSDALMIVKKLAVTVRFKDISSFKARYKVRNGPMDKGRNFFFAGVSFLSPLDCKGDDKIPPECRKILKRNNCKVKPKRQKKKWRGWNSWKFWGWNDREDKSPTEAPTAVEVDDWSDDWWKCQKKRQFRRGRWGL